MWRRGRKRGSGAADEPSDAAAGGSVSLPYDASAGASPSATVSLNVLPEVLTMIDASAEGIRAEGAVELGRLVDHAQGEAATVICEYLLEAGAHVNHENSSHVTALNLACENGHEQCAVLLLRAGARADIADDWGDTPLSIAEKNGMDTVLALMQ